MKELNHFFLGKGPLASVKGDIFFTKGHSDNPEGQMGVETPQSAVIFKKFNWN